MIQVTELAIPDVKLVTSSRHGDDRGFFSEVYNRADFLSLGIDDVFVQDNHSRSAAAGTIRGLHFQIDPRPIAKLVRVTKGAIWDVAVDIRIGSPTYGHHVSARIDEENWAQIYVPVGFAHGFCTLEPATEVVYKVTDHWSAEVDKGLAWDDPDLAIPWPVDSAGAVLSEKDKSQPKLADLPEYFTWGGES